MARNLIWKDLSAQQLESIRHPHPKKGLTGRDLLARYVGLADHDTNPQSAIQLDLLVHALQCGEEMKFADDKLSGLFSIVKSVHRRSVDEMLTLERSFKLFKEMLLAHSVQRPPYSVGLFTFAEMRRIMDWMVDSYFRHYKLYMYTYTNRVTLSAATVHPRDGVETAPELQPLGEAITQEQHEALLSEEERRREQEAAAAAAEAEAAAEADRVARLREEYEAAIPDEIRDQVSAAVERELALLKERMQQQFVEQQNELIAKITALQTAPPPPPPAPVKPPSARPAAAAVPAAAPAAAAAPPAAAPAPAVTSPRPAAASPS